MSDDDITPLEHRVSITPREDPRRVPAKWTWPIPYTESGREPRISDGRHTRADKAAGRSSRVHRGMDVMYRRKAPALKKGHPWGSKWYYIPRQVPTPALAAFTGTVIAAGILRTGGCIMLDHGDGIGTAYHHLRGVLVGPHTYMSESHCLQRGAAPLGAPEFGVGDVVPAGYPIGVVGGSPVGYGLAHLHFDYATNLNAEESTLHRGRLSGAFKDAAKMMRSWEVLPYSEAWDDVGTVAVG